MTYDEIYIISIRKYKKAIMGASGKVYSTRAQAEAQAHAAYANGYLP